MKISEKLKGRIDNKWLLKLTDLLDSEKTAKIFAELKKVKEQGIEIYPPQEDIFNAFKYTPYDKLKIIIIGEDPYHTPGSADGLAFSSKGSKKCPPSLRNILIEVENDIYNELNVDRNINDFTLNSWAEQGVLLLNTALTVEQGSAESHLELWTGFTVDIIKMLSNDNNGLIFMLWGSKAQAFKPFINQKVHHVLEAPHPLSSFARLGFIGCKHFSKANEIIEGQNGKEFIIKW